jgi:tRNA(Ile2) C34 agmatinyltransferase TiaS
MDRLKCGRCGYQWEYNGDRFYTSCPQCRTTVRTSKVMPKRVVKE